MCSSDLRSAQFGESGDLAARLSRWLSGGAPGVEVDPLTAELASFEAWTRAAPHHDVLAETFASLPPDEEALMGPGSRLRLNLTVRRREVSPRLVAALLSGEDDRALELMAARYNGTVRILVYNATIASILGSHQPDASPSEWLDRGHVPAVFELLEHGVFIWEPLPSVGGVI